MGATAWIGLGIATWLALALVVALCIGRMIRRRDEQVPRAEPLDRQPRGTRRADAAPDYPERYLRGQG